MAYREVGVFEAKEVLRLWSRGLGKKTIARRVGLDPKTVRTYVEAATDAGIVAGDETSLTDERVGAVLAALAGGGRPRGESWATCDTHRKRIEELLGQTVRLSKVRRLLAREGVALPYSTLYRYAVEELGFGRTAPTLPVADGEAGAELQVDTGWVVTLTDAAGKQRRIRAWIFTPGVSRYRFVWPIERETTESAIEACEAAWAFYGGVFRVLVPDNTKAIVAEAHPTHPRLSAGFLEYAQARGFEVDTARVRTPTDKGRVERSVRDTRDDCFGGERLTTVADAKQRARTWCADEYGMRRHSTTGRLPREHFDAVEKPALRLAPTEPYDVPLWCDPRVGRDQHAQVAKALYSLPVQYVGEVVRARADRTTVRFYSGQQLIVMHARQAPGGRATEPSHFQADRFAVATRDEGFLVKRACEQGPSVGRFAEAVLDVPLPWTRMRRVYTLLDLCRRYGATRVDETCGLALAAEMTDVVRLARMLEHAGPPPQTAPPAQPANVIPLARFLRSAQQYALPSTSKPEGER